MERGLPTIRGTYQSRKVENQVKQGGRISICLNLDCQILQVGIKITKEEIILIYYFKTGMIFLI